MPKSDNDIKASNFKSPLSKLVRVFKKSRDNWKAKYMEAKYKVKLLSNQVRYWKEQNAELKRQIEEFKHKFANPEEKNNLKENNVITKKFLDIPMFHTYSAGHIFLFVHFVLSGCISLRASSRILNLTLSFLNLDLPVPSWYTGRLWLLRIGLYKLERPKPIANDWIWIIDHTIQLGNEKCLVILGIRQAWLPKEELHLTHEELEPIALIPVDHSNGDIVFRQLEETIIKTGIPKQIVSDQASDIKSGVDKFREKYRTIHTFDFKHKGAAILKKELKDDPDWQDFIKNASATNSKVQQTDLAFLGPPNQRSKSRYMNCDRLVKWGMTALSYLDCTDTTQPKNEKLAEKFGWLHNFSEQLEEWQGLVELIKTANNYINFMGLYKHLDKDLKDVLSECVLAERYRHIRGEILDFVKEQQGKVPSEDRLLGSSEIIESVIGKYKGLQNDQVKGGITGMLLGLAASVSELTLETVNKAMASVSNEKLWNWIKENVGKSVYSKRKEAYDSVKNKEQKWDENLTAV
jgi:hypothetical protein